MFLVFEIFLNVIIGISINECGGVITVSKEIDDGCAKTMVNNSFVVENFGSEFEEKFSHHSNNYYPSELDNSENIVRSIDKLDDPGMSPQSKMIRNSECLIGISEEDRVTTLVHLEETKKGILEQLKDGVLFQMDNTEVSREDYVFSNKRNS
jgi:hypothetical protein